MDVCEEAWSLGAVHGHSHFQGPVAQAVRMALIGSVGCVLGPGGEVPAHSLKIYDMSMQHPPEALQTT